MSSCGIYLRAISREMLKISILHKKCKITFLMLRRHTQEPKSWVSGEYAYWSKCSIKVSKYYCHQFSVHWMILHVGSVWFSQIVNVGRKLNFDQVLVELSLWTMQCSSLGISMYMIHVIMVPNHAYQKWCHRRCTIDILLINQPGTWSNAIHVYRALGWDTYKYYHRV